MASHGKKPPNPQRVKPPSGARRKPPPPPSRGIHSSDQCCPMVASLVSVKRGKFRLAGRYARMSVRLLSERIA